jgi:carbonic anhydrase
MAVEVMTDVNGQGAATGETQATEAQSTATHTTASHGVDRLVEGNARFLDGIVTSPDPAGATAALATADPYAVVIGCSDSRVPPELIFDEWVGSLFVVRVAAHLAGQAELGSIEYAIARWNCPVLLVLGHTQCGAIAAAMDRLPPESEIPPSDPGAVNLGPLLSSVKFNLGTTSPALDPWLDAVTLNVHRTVEALSLWSPIIRTRVKLGQLAVAGAIYHVETGVVEFLDSPN